MPRVIINDLFNAANRTHNQNIQFLQEFQNCRRNLIIILAYI